MGSCNKLVISRDTGINCALLIQYPGILASGTLEGLSLNSNGTYLSEVIALSMLELITWQPIEVFD